MGYITYRLPLSAPPDTWPSLEKAGFRFAFIYFILQVVPLDWKYYQKLASIDWLHIHYREIFYIARYQPTFFDGPATFANWAVVASIALIGALIWGWRDWASSNYDALNYWLRVMLRYRLAAGILAYGIIKFFPLQAPEPSISNLNTAYGDFTAWKLFSLSLGVVPSYESFLGLVEIIAALLLLSRRTATIGTLIILPFTGNVFVSNLAYEGGEYVYSLYLIVIALYLFSFDAARLFRLITLEKATIPNRFNPVFAEQWQGVARLSLKTLFSVFFVGIYGYQTYAGYKQGAYHFPQKPGLPNAAGVYNVREFRINNQILPYSKTDSIRWQDVVFEKWATLSIKSNRPVKLASAETEEIYLNDDDRNYEFAGSQGRHYYQYEFDAAKQVLIMHNRNKAYTGETLRLHIKRPTPNELILSGIDQNQDSLYIILDKQDKKYLLDEARKAGRRRGLTL